MNGERRKKWKRDRNRRPIVLQPRDQEILLASYEYGLLTREQIQKLFNIHGLMTAIIRLRKLFDHGYLSRRFLPTTRGAPQSLYFLGPKGIRLVSERNGNDSLEIKRRQRIYFGRKEMFFAHDLSVNEVRIAFHQALNKAEGFKLDRWIPSVDCLQEHRILDPKTHREFKKVFRPDGYFRYFQNGRLFGSFLEMDRSTMNNGRFQSKVKTYLDYAQSDLYRERYGLKFFRVLIVTKTSQRLLNLKSATERLTDKIFWFTTFDDLKPDQIFERIWQRPGKDERFSLFEQ